MKKGLITLTLAVLPVFGFANINLLSLVSSQPIKTDSCVAQYYGKNNPQFCTCYGDEMHNGDPFHRPAHQIFKQMCTLGFANACKAGCKGDHTCETDCVSATNDYVSAGCDKC